MKGGRKVLSIVLVVFFAFFSFSFSGYGSSIEELEAKKDVKGLIKALRNKDSGVRKAAAEALGKIGDQRAVEPLIEALRDEYWRVRIAVAYVLSKIGDQRAVEPLIQALRDEYWDVREAAAKALEKIEPEWYKTEVAKKQVPEFINALRHWDPDVRRAAAKALEKIEPEWYKTEAAGRQVPEFVKILVKAKDEEYCNYLKKLIEKNGAGAVVEVTNELVNVRWASEEGDGWIGATNHFVSMEMYQHNNGISESSVWRLAVIREVLNNSVKFGLVDAVDLLRSHYDLYLGSEYPGDRSVCNHDPMWSSMSAFIVVPKLNYTLVCIGHPCQNDFYLVSFNKFLGPVI